jgi:hypothetical protein
VAEAAEVDVVVAAPEVVAATAAATEAMAEDATRFGKLK